MKKIQYSTILLFLLLLFSCKKPFIMLTPELGDGTFGIPKTLIAVAWDEAVTLNWPVVPEAVSYNLYRSTTPGTGTGGTLIANVKPGYIDILGSGSNGTTYYYVVTAVDSSAAETAASPEASVEPYDVPVDGLVFKDADLSDYIHSNYDGQYVHDITDLSVYSTNGISDLTGLEKLVHLEHLYLSYNKISDISPLSGLTALYYLSLTSNNISDISPLSGLTALATLYLGGNRISDVSPLSGLTALTNLYLQNNSISDVSSLSGLTALVYLRLCNNSIRTGVKDLDGLINASSIDLSGNPDIPQADIDYLINALPGCNISYD